MSVNYSRCTSTMTDSAFIHMSEAMRSQLASTHNAVNGSVSTINNLFQAVEFWVLYRNKPFIGHFYLNKLQLKPIQLLIISISISMHFLQLSYQNFLIKIHAIKLYNLRHNQQALFRSVNLNWLLLIFLSKMNQRNKPNPYFQTTLNCPEIFRHVGRN